MLIVYILTPLLQLGIHESIIGFKIYGEHVVGWPLRYAKAKTLRVCISLAISLALLAVWTRTCQALLCPTKTLLAPIEQSAAHHQVLALQAVPNHSLQNRHEGCYITDDLAAISASDCNAQLLSCKTLTATNVKRYVNSQ
eukprot:2489024-Amphidinium_carterae.1